MLVDSGSTHSFIGAKVAEELKLALIKVPTITVSIADGRKLISNTVANSHGRLNNRHSPLISECWTWAALM